MGGEREKRSKRWEKLSEKEEEEEREQGGEIKVNKGKMKANESDVIFLMIRRPQRSTPSRSSAASDVYTRQPPRTS